MKAIPDSSYETSPSAPSLPSSTSDSQTPITSQPCNVNTLTPSKRPRSHFVDIFTSTTFSSPPFPHTTSNTDRPPIC